VLVIVFREVRLQCLFLTCRRRKVDQLYCPKYGEFAKHVKCSGDFLCTINDLDFVVFVLYYMVIPYLVVNLCHSTFSHKFPLSGVQQPREPMAIQKKGCESPE